MKRIHLSETSSIISQCKPKEKLFHLVRQIDSFTAKIMDALLSVLVQKGSFWHKYEEQEKLTLTKNPIVKVVTVNQSISNAMMHVKLILAPPTKCSVSDIGRKSVEKLSA